VYQDEHDLQQAKQIGQPPYSLRQRISLVTLLGVLMLLVRAVTSSAQDAARGFVNCISIDGPINPAVAEFIRESIHTSHQDGARALVIQLDTPGGLLFSEDLKKGGRW
jgi:membrane-bound ClpP family serine protease